MVRECPACVCLCMSVSPLLACVCICDIRQAFERICYPLPFAILFAVCFFTLPLNAAEQKSERRMRQKKSEGMVRLGCCCCCSRLVFIVAALCRHIVALFVNLHTAHTGETPQSPREVNSLLPGHTLALLELLLTLTYEFKCEYMNIYTEYTMPYSWPTREFSEPARAPSLAAISRRITGEQWESHGEYASHFTRH